MRYTTQFADGGGVNLSHRHRVQKIKETEPPEGWTKHTQWHWSRILNGKKLDFWPTKDKWRYEDQNYFGDVDKFIEIRTNQND